MQRIHGSDDSADADREESKLIAASDRTVCHAAKKKKSLLFNKPLMASITLYCIWSLHDMAYTEVRIFLHIVQKRKW